MRIVSEFIHKQESSDSIKAENIIFTLLKGGRSQASLYRFSLHDQSFVLRIFAPQANEAIRRHQITLAELASKLDVGPRVLYVDPQLEGLIMEYISGEAVAPTIFEDTDKLSQFAHLLKLLHKSTEMFPIAYSPFARFHEFLSRAPNNTLSEFIEITALMNDLEALLKLCQLPNVPTHLDLNSQNILFSNGRFVLVDWVNGGMSDAFFDLATFAVFHDLNDNQSFEFLRHYFNRTPTDLEWSRFVIIQPIRLFVIAAAYLTTTERSSQEVLELPTFAGFLKENAHGKTNLSHFQIGSIMLKAGIKLIEDQKFKGALKDFATKMTRTSTDFSTRT